MRKLPYSGRGLKRSAIPSEAVPSAGNGEANIDSLRNISTKSNNILVSTVSTISTKQAEKAKTIEKLLSFRGKASGDKDFQGLRSFIYFKFLDLQGKKLNPFRIVVCEWGFFPGILYNFCAEWGVPVALKLVREVIELPDGFFCDQNRSLKEQRCRQLCDNLNNAAAEFKSRVETEEARLCVNQ